MKIVTCRDIDNFFAFFLEMRAWVSHFVCWLRRVAFKQFINQGKYRQRGLLETTDNVEGDNYNEDSCKCIVLQA